MVKKMILPFFLNLALAATACRRSDSGHAAASAEGTLTGRQWTLVELDGQTIEASAAAQPPNLSLGGPDNQATGFAGCNRFTGSYELTRNYLHFGPLATTRMACPTGMELEDKYLGALGAAREYRLAANQLELVADGRVLARFESR